MSMLRLSKTRYINDKLIIQIDHLEPSDEEDHQPFYAIYTSSPVEGCKPCYLGMNNWSGISFVECNSWDQVNEKSVFLLETSTEEEYLNVTKYLNENS